MNSNSNPIEAVQKDEVRWIEYYVSSRNYEELGLEMEMNSNGNPGKSISIICAVQKDEEKQRYIEEEKRCLEMSESGRNYEELGSELEISKICAVQNSKLEIKGSYFEASYIVFKSCLYRIGGCYRDEVYGGEDVSKTVDKLDLKNMDLGWVKVAEMNCRRINPYIVILGGKLYVVGGLISQPEEETAILMEVFESDEFGCETISNPPLPNPDEVPDVYYYDYVYDNESGRYMYVKRKREFDNRYLKQVYRKVIAGGVERETDGDGFIFVIVPDEYETYYYHTYEVKAKIWMPYTKFTSSDLKDNDYFRYSSISMQPAVVSGQLMLFLGLPEILYVMDLERGNLCTIDLLKRSVIDEDRLDTGRPPYLVMIEKGKFCVFWEVVGPKCKKTGKVYIILKGCIFTLQRRTKRKTYRVNKKSTWFSLLPDLTTTHKLEAVCLVDFIPDLPNSKILL